MKNTFQRRAEALADFLDEWEAENSPLTPDELANASAQIELPGSLPSFG